MCPTASIQPRDFAGAIVAVATITNKQVNQDAVALLKSASGRCSGVVVADGLGSHYGAEVASATAVETFRCAAALSSPDNPMNAQVICTEIVRRLERHIEEHAAELPPNLDFSNAFGTTLVFAIDEPGRIQLGYLGNGAIVHIRADFTDFPVSQLLPWSAVNYLNPHSVPRNGRNVLYKLLSPFASLDQSSPTLLTITKDSAFAGDIVMICSDGVCSYDQTCMGTDGDGRIWIHGEPSLTEFYAALTGFLRTGVYTADELSRTLQQYLSCLHERGLVTDDCTLGVLITEQAVRFHASRLGDSVS